MERSLVQLHALVNDKCTSVRDSTASVIKGKMPIYCSLYKSKF